jgi:integrase
MATIQKRERKNGPIYRVMVRIQGFPEQTKSFKRLTDAKMWAQQTESDIRKGDFKNVVKEASKHTLSKVIERYAEDILPSKATNTQRAESTWLAAWDRELGTYALSFITTELISKKMKAIANAGDARQDNPTGTKSPRTMKHYRGTLELLFKYAIEWGWTANNPVEGIKQAGKINNNRARFLDDDERGDLITACKNSPNKQLHAVVIFALSTGARKNEILSLKDGDLDLEKNTAILRDTKNGETRSVPIMGPLQKLMKDQINRRDKLNKKLPAPTDYIFPRRDGLKPIDIRKAWENARDKAKIQDFRFHDLRHSAASYLAMNGATLLEIAAVLGHKTLQMVKRYSHLSEDHTRGIIEKMNEKMF